MSGLAPYLAGAEPRPLAAARAWLFTDLHLSPERTWEVEAFARRLHALAADGSGSGARVVIVMGDLFDAYAGPEDWDLPGFAPLRAACLRLREAGVALWLLRGNRDVMLEPLAAPLDAAEVADGVLLRLGARPPALITHGDAFCLRDRRYQFLRRALRGPRLRAFLLRRSCVSRRWLAARLRGVSRGEMARKPLADLDVVEEALAAELRRHGAACAVIGHLHQDRRLPLGAGLRARVLPAWDPEAPAWDAADVLDDRA